jgi:hypothetical protein
MTIDEILQAYDDGLLTVDELSCHLLRMLSHVSPETIRERLRVEAGREEAFDDWVDAVASGAELLSGGRPVFLSEDERVAISRYREAARPARYARLAELIQQWVAEPHDEEPPLGPEDIAPFMTTDVQFPFEEAVPA